MIPYGAEGKKKNLAYVFLNHTVSLIQKKKDLSNIVCTEEKFLHWEEVLGLRKEENKNAK